MCKALLSATEASMRLAVIIGHCLFAVPALAADEAPRYTMSPTEGGIIRLDTVTGTVSTCTSGAGGMVCRSAADDRAGLEQEIDRLVQENRELKQKLADTRPGLKLPDEKDVDQALGVFDRFMRRFKDIIDEWRREDGTAERT
jgi:hypothetical protein